MFNKMLIFLLSFCSILSGCAPVLFGGAATTVAVVHDRRSAGTVLDDNTLKLNILGKLSADKTVSQNSHIEVTVYNGKALLTGEAYNENIRRRAEKITQQQEDINSVHNYITIGRRSSFFERSYDSKQTAKVKSALFRIKIKDFDAMRVKVVTEHGVTYLLGLLTTQEAAAVTQTVRRVSGVKKVVSLFELTSSPP